MALAADSGSAKRWTLTLRKVVPLGGGSRLVGDEVAEGIAGPAPIVEELRGFLGAAQRRDHLRLAALGLVDQDQTGRHLRPGSAAARAAAASGLRCRGQVRRGSRRRRRSCASVGSSSGSGVGRRPGAPAVGVTVASAFGSAADSGAGAGVPGAVTRASAVGVGAGGTIEPAHGIAEEPAHGRDGADQHHGDGNPAQALAAAGAAGAAGVAAPRPLPAR